MALRDGSDFAIHPHHLIMYLCLSMISWIYIMTRMGVDATRGYPSENELDAVQAGGRDSAQTRATPQRFTIAQRRGRWQAMGLRMGYSTISGLLRLLLLGALELEVVLLLALDCNATNTSQSLGDDQRTRDARRRARGGSAAERTLTAREVDTIPEERGVSMRGARRQRGICADQKA